MWQGHILSGPLYASVADQGLLVIPHECCNLHMKVCDWLAVKRDSVRQRPAEHREP